MGDRLPDGAGGRGGGATIGVAMNAGSTLTFPGWTFTVLPPGNGGDGATSGAPGVSDSFRTFP